MHNGVEVWKLLGIYDIIKKASLIDRDLLRLPTNDAQVLRLLKPRENNSYSSLILVVRALKINP